MHICQARISASRLLAAEKSRPESEILHVDVAVDNEFHNRCANIRDVGHIGPFSRDLSSIQERGRAPEGSDLVRESNAKRAGRIFRGACKSPEQTAPRSYDQHARAQECVVTVEGAWKEQIGEVIFFMRKRDFSYIPFISLLIHCNERVVDSIHSFKNLWYANVELVSVVCRGYVNNVMAERIQYCEF